MSLFPTSAVERAMKMQEVILRAVSKEISWIKAAEILGRSDRQMRRIKRRYEFSGYDGLLDRRTGRPSPKRINIKVVEQILGLYRDRYRAWNMRHFHQWLVEKHGISVSYSFTQKALQTAGLVKRSKKRGPHRIRRAPKECFGEMLHIDGSTHAWLQCSPKQKMTLILCLDDSSSRVLGGEFFESESSLNILKVLHDVVWAYGIPMSLYNDRASWAFYTPKAGEEVDKDVFTGVGKVLHQLGVEHIPAYSPQARGRSERANRTFQDRLVNELKLAGVTTMAQANEYLQKVYIPDHNKRFTRDPVRPESVFVSAAQLDLNEVFYLEETRTVTKDNVVMINGTKLQIQKQPGRATCQGLRVLVKQHLCSDYSVWHGIRCLGRYTADGIEKVHRPQNHVYTSQQGTGGEAAGWITAPASPLPEPRRLSL